MRVLITNDDGAHATGIGLLARCLSSRGVDVVVVAPATEASGSSAGLGQVEAGGTVPSKLVELALAPGVEAHAVEAPPAMCVLAGLTEAFGPVPDVVLSGVNNGHNLGRAVIHSGTVGAALTARMLKVAALAVSAPALSVETGHTPGTGPDMTAMVAVAELAAELLGHLERWPRAALNVNVPVALELVVRDLDPVDPGVDDLGELPAAQVRDERDAGHTQIATQPPEHVVREVTLERRSGHDADPRVERNLQRVVVHRVDVASRHGTRRDLRDAGAWLVDLTLLHVHRRGG